MTQAQGQSCSAFLDKVVAACTDAEMEKLTTDQLIVHIVLACLVDQETKEKLHELENPSIKELRHAAKRMDVIKVKVRQLKPVPTLGCHHLVLSGGSPTAMDVEVPRCLGSGALGMDPTRLTLTD